MLWKKSPGAGYPSVAYAAFSRVVTMHAIPVAKPLLVKRKCLSIQDFKSYIQAISSTMIGIVGINVIDCDEQR
jgi:hypothetical protein